MRRNALLLALALAAATYRPLAQAQAGAKAVAASHSPEVTERAMTLARVLNSEAIIIGTAADDEAAMALVPELISQNAELGDIEKRYPGITLEIARAMTPITNRSMHERLPILWQRQAALYASTFTAPELDTLIAFYQSPTGAKMIRVMMEKMHPHHALAEAAKSSDLHFSGNSVIADIKDTVPDILSELNAEDQAALLRLAGSGVLGKMRAIAPDVQQAAIDWMAETTPEEAAETDRIVADVLARHMKKSKK